MKRRPFLHLAVGSVATTGWLGASESATAPADASDSAQGTPRVAVSDREASEPPLSLDTVETFEYVVRLNDLGDDPSGAVTAASELSERERRIFETAVEEGYQTADPPEWLVQFASATPVVERRGTYYRLENTFPTYTLTAEAVAEGDVDRRIAPYEAYQRAVTHDGAVKSALLAVARREGMELSYVWPDLRAFFKTYDAVRYRGDLLSFSVAVEDAGPPYRIAGAKIPVSEAVRGPVWNANETPSEVRNLVRRAGRARGAYGFDRAPEGLLSNLRSHEYVHLDGTFYTASIEKEATVPVAVSARFTDGKLRFEIRNEGDRELRTSSGPPRPFGVLRCHPKGDPETHHLLWTDAYEKSAHVRTTGREVTLVDDVGLTATLAPGASASETYEVAEDLSPGEYVVADSVGVETPDGSSTLRYRVGFSVG